MMQNGSGIPVSQRATYKCDCGGSVFEQKSALRFVYDRLDPDKMVPNPVTMFQCMDCKGFLTKVNGAWKTVHPESNKPPIEGDEWKAT